MPALPEIPLPLRALLSIICALPRPVALALARFSCAAAWHLNRPARQAVLDNLSVVLAASRPTSRDLRRAARQTFRNYATFLLTFLRLRTPTPDFARKALDPASAALLRALAAEPRGAILLTAHLGDWELGGALLAALGLPITAVVRPHPSPALEALYTLLRRRRRIDLLPLGRPRAVLQALRDRRIVAILGDRDFTGTAPLRPFFHRPAPIPDGPARLAFAANVPIYPAFASHSPDGAPRLQILPPLRPADYPSPDALQTALLPLLQTAVAAAPTTWFVFTPFFPGSSELS